MAGIFGTDIADPRTPRIKLQSPGIASAPVLRAAQPVRNSNVDALVRSLGGLNAALEEYGKVDRAIKNDPNSTENKEYFARLQMMTPEQLREEARTGSSDGIRVRNDALNALLGERASSDFRVSWSSYYNTDFDRTYGDAGAEFDRMREDFAADLPTEISKANFYRQTDAFRGSWMEKDAAEKTEHTKTLINSTILDGMRNSVDDDLHASVEPSEIVRKVFQRSSANRDFLGLSGQEQNETLFALAQEYAQRGEVEVVRQLLTADRQGGNGEVIPSLSRIAGYTTKAEALIERADGAWRKNQDAQSFTLRREVEDQVAAGAFTEDKARTLQQSGIYQDSELSSLVGRSNAIRAQAQQRLETERQRAELRAHSERQEAKVYGEASAAMGQYAGVGNIRDVEVPSADGNGTRTIARQSIIDEVTRRQEDAFSAEEERLTAAGMPREEAVRQVNSARVAWYAGNKVENKKWATMFSGMPAMATVETLKDSPEMLAAVTEQAELYRTISAQNPAYASTLVDGKSKEWMERYTDFVELFGSSPKDAAFQTSTWAAKPEREKIARLPNPTEMDRAVSRAVDKAGGEALPVNDLAVRSRARALYELGLPSEQVEEHLAKYVKERSFVVNGVIVFDHRGLPKNFPDLVQRQLSGIYETTGKARGVPSQDDLYLAPVSGESKWAVYSKSMGIPIGAFIDPDGLQATQQEVNAEREERIREEARKAEEARRAPRAKDPRGRTDRNLNTRTFRKDERG